MTNSAATSTKKAAQVKPKASGQIAIFWNPQKDGAVPVPTGADSARPFAFFWVKDLSEVEKRRELEQKAFDSGRPRQAKEIEMGEFYLSEVGLNWVKASTWEQVKAASARMAERDGDEDEVARLMSDGAIQEISSEGGRADDINAYEYSQAVILVGAESNLNRLYEWRAEASNRRVVERINERIGQVNGEF